MPTKEREIREGPPPEEGEEDTRPVTIILNWTRDEQIENAIAADEEHGRQGDPAVDVRDIEPPLTAEERARHGIRPP